MIMMSSHNVMYFLSSLAGLAGYGAYIHALVSYLLATCLDFAKSSCGKCGILLSLPSAVKITQIELKKTIS